MIVTRNLFAWALHGGFLQRISMLHLISNKGHDFLGKRFLWIGISLTVIAISIVGFAIRGERNFGIDFRGGDLLMLEPTKQKVEIAEVRKEIEKIGFEPVVQKEAEPALNKEYISIRSPFNTSDKIEKHLIAA